MPNHPAAEKAATEILEYKLYFRDGCDVTHAELTRHIQAAIEDGAKPLRIGLAVMQNTIDRLEEELAKHKPLVEALRQAHTALTARGAPYAGRARDIIEAALTRFKEGER